MLIDMCRDRSSDERSVGFSRWLRSTAWLEEQEGCNSTCTLKYHVTMAMKTGRDIMSECCGYRQNTGLVWRHTLMSLLMCLCINRHYEKSIRLPTAWFYLMNR